MLSLLTVSVIAVAYLYAITRPAWAVAVVLTMFATEQLLQASSPVFRTHGSLANFIVGVVVLCALTKSFLVGTLRWKHWITPAAVLTLLLYLYAGISWFWTASPEWLAEYIRWTSPYILVTLGLAPLLVGGFKDLKDLRVAMLVIGTTVAVLIILSPGFELVNGRYVVNVDNDSHTNPLAIGALGGMLVLLAVLGPSTEILSGIISLRVVAFVAGLGLGFMSGSRGEVIAAIFFSLLFLPMARRINNLGQFIGTATVAVIFVVGVYFIRGIFVGADNEDRWSSEGMLYGSLGRFENAADLADHYFRRPIFWLTGLGSAAFHDLPTRSGDPYSHVIVADLIFELGIPGIVLGTSIFALAASNSRRLFAMVMHDPPARALVAYLAAFTAYEFTLANKAGILWAQYDLFFGTVLLGRLFALESDEQLIAESALDDEDSSAVDDEDQPVDAESAEPHAAPSTT